MPTFTPPVKGTIATSEIPKPKAYNSVPQWKKDQDAWFDDFAKSVPTDPKQSIFLEISDTMSYRKLMGLIRGGLDRTGTTAKMRSDHDTNKVYVYRTVDKPAAPATPQAQPVAAGAR